MGGQKKNGSILLTLQLIPKLFFLETKIKISLVIKSRFPASIHKCAWQTLFPENVVNINEIYSTGPSDETLGSLGYKNPVHLTLQRQIIFFIQNPIFLVKQINKKKKDLLVFPRVGLASQRHLTVVFQYAGRTCTNCHINLTHKRPKISPSAGSTNYYSAHFSCW